MHQQLWRYKVEAKLYLGDTRTKKFEYHYSKGFGVLAEGLGVFILNTVTVDERKLPCGS
jgi:hypothetical protein